MKNLFLVIIISSYSYNFLQAAQAEDPFTTPKRERKSQQPVIVVTPTQDAASADQSAKNDDLRIFLSELDHDEFDYASDTSCSSQKSTDSFFKALIDQHVQPIEIGPQSSIVDKVMAPAKKRSKREEEKTSQVAAPADMPKSVTQDYYDEALTIIRKKDDINISSTTSLSLFTDYLRTIKKSTIPKNIFGQNPAHFVYNKPQYKTFLHIITRFRPAWLSEADHFGKLPAAYKAAPKKPDLKQKRKKRK